jgi:hypothetical protein
MFASDDDSIDGLGEDTPDEGGEGDGDVGGGRGGGGGEELVAAETEASAQILEPVVKVPSDSDNVSMVLPYYSGTSATEGFSTVSYTEKCAL